MSDKDIYIVTGAAGFLGGNVCRELIEKGHRVRAFVLPDDKAIKYVPDKAEIIEGDLTHPESLLPLFKAKSDESIYVIHSASLVTIDAECNEKVLSVNVGGTKNLINACLSSPSFKKMVYVSSTGAIPELPKGQKIKEVDYFDPASDPEHVVGYYSQSKALATQAVLDAVHNRELNATIVHPTGILGPDDYSVSTTTYSLIQIINGNMPIGIDGSFNLCDVRDLAAGCVAALEKGRKGECYILGNQEVSYREFVKLVCREANAKPVYFFLPCRLAYFIASIAEKRARRKGIKPVLTRFAVYNLARNNDYDSVKAQQELGFKVRSYRETIHDECMWLKKEGMVKSAS